MHVYTLDPKSRLVVSLDTNRRLVTDSVDRNYDVSLMNETCVNGALKKAERKHGMGDHENGGTAKMLDFEIENCENLEIIVREIVKATDRDDFPSKIDVCNLDFLKGLCVLGN